LKILIEWLKKRFSDVESTVVSLLVLGFVSWSGWAVLSKNLRPFLFELLQTSTPLWSTILLVCICIGLTYYLIARLKKPSQTLRYKIKYYDIGNYRWKVKVFRRDYFEVEKTPLCIKHDMQFVSSFENYGSFHYCPKCNKKISYTFNESDKIYSEAISQIDKKVRDDF
jgi:hypothetical protein